MPISLVEVARANSTASASAASGNITFSGSNLYGFAAFGSANGGGAATHDSATVGAQGLSSFADLTAFFGLIRGSGWAAALSAGSSVPFTCTAGASQDVGVSGALAIYSGVDSVRDSDSAFGEDFSGTQFTLSTPAVTSQVGDTVLMAGLLYMDTVQDISSIDNLGTASVVVQSPASGSAGIHSFIIAMPGAAGTTTPTARVNVAGSTLYGWVAASQVLIPAAAAGNANLLAGPFGKLLAGKL